MAMVSATNRAARAGREGRRRDRAVPAAPAYLTRRIPAYELLSEEGLVAIEDHADKILAEVRFEIRGDAEAIELFRTAGARASEGVRLRFPRGLVRSIIQRTAPREFVQHARNPNRSVRIGCEATVFSPAYGSRSSQISIGGAGTVRSRTSAIS